MSVPTNNGPNDPDNNPRWKPPKTKPKKKVTKKSTAPVRVGAGPRDPENDPRKYHNYGPAGDTGDYVGSSYFPGFKLGQTDPSGKALKPDDYRAWMAGNQSSPWFQAMRSTYGDSQPVVEVVVATVVVAPEAAFPRSSSSLQPRRRSAIRPRPTACRCRMPTSRPSLA